MNFKSRCKRFKFIPRANAECEKCYLVKCFMTNNIFVTR